MEPDSGRKQTNTECAGVAQGFARNRRLEGRGERWAEGFNLTGLMPEHVDICLHCVRLPQIVVPGRISGLREGPHPLPRELEKKLLVVPKASSHQDTTPVLSPQYPWALSVPLAGSGQARCRGPWQHLVQVPVSFKLAGSWICHLVALSTGNQPSALTPRLGHKSTSCRVEFHSSPCRLSFFPLLPCPSFSESPALKP